jgi:hypothetical protein
LASDALLSEWAESFIERLSDRTRGLWLSALDDFLANPVNDSTIWYPEAGDPEARATVIHPFLIIWKEINAEVIAIATIRWGPDAPAGQPGIGLRM